MRNWWIPIVAVIAGTASSAPDGKFTEYDTLLNGPAGGQPAIQILHTMETVTREVYLHVAFPRGLHRRKTRGTTAGIYIEVNDADMPTHPVRNPFSPVPVDKSWNPDWKDYIANDFPYPNPSPGYWYTSGAQKDPLQRPIRLRFATPGRYRIRLRGVLPAEKSGPRCATIRGVTEVGGVSSDAPLRPGCIRAALAIPTGERATSVLLLERDAPKTVTVGKAFTYVVRVTNLTARPIEHVELIEHGPAGFSIEKSDVALRAERAGAVTLPIGTLEAGQEREVTLTARIETAGAQKRSLRARWDSRAVLQTTNAK